MNRVIAAVAMIATGLVLGGAPASSGSYPQCEDAVSELLATLDIGPTSVESIAYVPELAGGRSGTSLVGVVAWVDLEACSGSVVIEMNLRCRVKDVYTHGECRVPGLTAY